jgi:hypothetical protein
MISLRLPVAVPNRDAIVRLCGEVVTKSRSRTISGGVVSLGSPRLFEQHLVFLETQDQTLPHSDNTHHHDHITRLYNMTPGR